MRSTPTPAPDRLRPWLRVAVAAVVALWPVLWAVGGLEGTPAGAVNLHAMTGHQRQAGASSGLTTGQKGVAVHGHKEGPLAVAFSVLGVIVVVAFIVGLGALSIRRRSRDGPRSAHQEWLDRWRRPFG
jgi:hypothetical protein